MWRLTLEQRASCVMSLLPVVALAAGGCFPATGVLEISHEGVGREVWESVVRAEVAVVAGETRAGHPVECWQLTTGVLSLDDLHARDDWTGAVPDPNLPALHYESSFRLDGDEVPSIGLLPEGAALFFARVRDDRCRVVAQGCSAAQLATGEDERVTVALEPLALPEPCPEGLDCIEGACARCPGCAEPDGDADADADGNADAHVDGDADSEADAPAGARPYVATQLSAGDAHICAVLESGALRCWGRGDLGRLGYGNVDTIGDDETPATAGDVDVGGVVLQIAAGASHTCALLESGAVRCWGAIPCDGSTDAIGDDETPASVGDVDVGGRVRQIAAGASASCAVLESGALRCWGCGDSGVLGYGNTEDIGDDETPASAGDVDVGGPVLQVALSRRHSCALLESGSVRCWGWGESGRIGYPHMDTIGDDETPASAGDVDLGGEVLQISAGRDHTCALLASGALRCWGSGDLGQLGYGNTEDIGDDETPASAGDVGVGGEVLEVAAGGDHTCVLLASGAVQCWGTGDEGQLGLGYRTTNSTAAWASDVRLGRAAQHLALGQSYACALLDSDMVRCWGSGRFGQLGYGSTLNVGDDELPSAAGDVPLM